MRSLNSILIILFFAVTCKAQRLQYVSAENVNANFIYEFRRDNLEIWTEFILKINSDSTRDKHVVVISGERDVRNFILYLECHIKSCFKDEQPLFLPGMPKLTYDEKSRYYMTEEGDKWFRRRRFLSLLRGIQKEFKKTKLMNIPYSRKKYIF